MECVKDARLKQKDYFCIPVMAYHSFIIYTVDGIKTFDTWSMNKDKNTCWMSNALEQLFQEERKDGGMLDGVTKISFWSDNGPPYHSGEWMLQLLNLGLTDYSESYSAAGIGAAPSCLVALDSAPGHWLNVLPMNVLPIHSGSDQSGSSTSAWLGRASLELMGTLASSRSTSRRGSSCTKSRFGPSPCRS